MDLAVNKSIAACFVIFCLLGDPVAAAYCTLQCQQTETDPATGKHCGAKKAPDEASLVLTSSVSICDHGATIVTTVTPRHEVSQGHTIDFVLTAARTHSAAATSIARLQVGAHDPQAVPTLNLPLRI